MIIFYDVKPKAYQCIINKEVILFLSRDVLLLLNNNNNKFMKLEATT